MQAFFSDDQLLHDPQQYMRVGRICKPADLPMRAEALMATLAGRGIAVSAPPDAGRGALEQVHSTDYLDYLETAFERWRKVESFGLEPGIEVLPNMSPHGPRVGPCPSPSVLAQTGWYVGDLSCPIGPNTWRSVLRSAHAALAAAEAVLDGGSIAYALCRPSGHHAQRARAAGFCYVNNSAIAAATLRQRQARVAVLVSDAHRGAGTRQRFYPRHSHPHALVPPLGFDTYKDDRIIVLRFELEAFRLAGERVRALGLPTVVVQEGGYMVGAIGAALDAFLEGLRA